MDTIKALEPLHCGRPDLASEMARVDSSLIPHPSSLFSSLIPHISFLLLISLLSFTFIGPAQGQQIHRNGFESREPQWVKGPAEVAFRELAHEITDSTAHTGQNSEHLQVSCEQAGNVYYFYPTAKAPLGDELSATIWIKANRPGVQLLAELVLPKEREPKALDQPLTVLLRGDVYQWASRWWPLRLRQPAKLARQQQQLMRAKLNRDVDFSDAYIDRLIINVCAGPGITELWIDDLEIGPVEEKSPLAPANATPQPTKLIAPGSPPPPLRAATVEMNNGQLLVNGKRFMLRGIRHSDTPLKTLRDAGFNAVWLDRSTSPALMEEAVNLGFWLVPSLSILDHDPRLASESGLRQEVARFLEREAVLFWDLGGGLTDEQANQVIERAKIIRSADPDRPITADAWDGLLPYTRSLDLLAVHRWPLFTGMELTQYRQWLNQRRVLSRNGTFLWTWIQTHLPEWYSSLVYEHSTSAGYDEPVGPQPEQIRLLTYCALTAGIKGLAFWSDRFLADSHQGRDRLLALAILNQELRMLEPLLLTMDTDHPTWIDTSIPDVKAAVLRCEKGLLVLPIWMGRGSQFVPGQAAVSRLSLVVPQAPAGTQAWEVSPSEVRSLRQERVVGGTRIELPEFGLTAAIVFSADNSGLIVRFQEQVRQGAKQAAHWSHDLAQEEILKVARVEEQLKSLGHTQPDSEKLLQNARGRLRVSEDYYNKGYYREADAEAQRTLRPLRILMRAQWEEAEKPLGTAVASPYAVCYYTLPRHWRFMNILSQATPGANLLTQGDFEDSPDPHADPWTEQTSKLDNDDIQMVSRRVSTQPHDGRQCMMLQINPKHPEQAPDALERAFLARHSPTINFQPGSVVRISVWIRIPQPIASSADGVLFYDNAGGEPLAIRLQETAGRWQQFTLYRRVPSDGTLKLTLALTGIGTVFFDDIRVEPYYATISATAGAP
jgi:hypothetical protein